MKLLERHAAFVKDQIFLQQKLANRFRDTPWRSQKHADNAANLMALLSDLEIAQEKIEFEGGQNNVSGNSVVSHGLMMRSEDLDDLPQELMAELSLSETDKLEFEILDIIKKAGGVLPLNKILVGLYRKTGAVHKRAAMTSRLYRMVQRERLFSVPGYKGVYSIRPINDDEASRLLGMDQIGIEIEEAEQDA